MQWSFFQVNAYLHQSLDEVSIKILNIINGECRGYLD